MTTTTTAHTADNTDDDSDCREVPPTRSFFRYVVFIIVVYVVIHYVKMLLQYQTTQAWWRAWPSPKQKLVSLHQILSVYYSVPIGYLEQWRTSPSGRLNLAQSAFFLNRLMRHAYTESAAAEFHELPSTFLKPYHMTDSALYTEQPHGGTRRFQAWLARTPVAWAPNPVVARFTTAVVYGQQATGQRWGLYPRASDVVGWMEVFERWCGLLGRGANAPHAKLADGVPRLFTAGSEGVPYVIDRAVFTNEARKQWFNTAQHPDNFLGALGVELDSPLLYAYVNNLAVDPHTGASLDPRAFRNLVGNTHNGSLGGWFGLMKGMGDNVNADQYSNMLFTDFPQFAPVVLPPAPCRAKGNTGAYVTAATGVASATVTGCMAGPQGCAVGLVVGLVLSGISLDNDIKENAKC
jgi:hypothetical protein